VTHPRLFLGQEYTPRGMGLDLHVGGVTSRAGPLYTPRGYETATHIAAGMNHVCLVHQSGQMYTWGVGSGGRLGHDTGEKADPRADCTHPTLVVGLTGKAVAKAACGFNHTMALTGTGAWGHRR
jgi:alpha-tubulin suppressor-like RCC1 family protein